jgi:hypothetical protein
VCPISVSALQHTRPTLSHIPNNITPQIFALLEFYAVQTGSLLPTFRNDISLPPSRVKNWLVSRFLRSSHHSHHSLYNWVPKRFTEFFFDLLTLEGAKRPLLSADQCSLTSQKKERLFYTAKRNFKRSTVLHSTAFRCNVLCFISSLFKVVVSTVLLIEPVKKLWLQTMNLEIIALWGGWKRQEVSENGEFRGLNIRPVFPTIFYGSLHVFLELLRKFTYISHTLVPYFFI